MADQTERMVARFREVLAETERLAPDARRAYQHDLLVPLILHARRNVPFYGDRLAPLFRGAAVDLARWREVPLLTRADVQRSLAALTARAVPPHAGPIGSDETSGSTGRPIRYRINRLAVVASLGTTDRALRWWGFDGDKTMASLVARRGDAARPPDGLTETGWRIGFSGPHHMLDLSAGIDAQVDWLAARRPHYLTAHSFALKEVAERARARGAGLRLERINSVGTVLTDEIRSACRDAFGARPIDQYGAQEAGLLACECPWCGRYHVNAETVLVEILDREGAPSPPGEAGRVVVTPFYNYAMPLIRYEIGDLAVAGPEDAACRVTLPTLGRIMGRYRNTFTLEDGRTIYPYVPAAALRRFIAFEQVQIVQTAPAAIEVRYVPPAAGRAVDADGLEACLQAALDPSFSVRAVAVAAIPRSPSGKFEDYLSLVPRRHG